MDEVKIILDRFLDNLDSFPGEQLIALKDDSIGYREFLLLWKVSPLDLTKLCRELSGIRHPENADLVRDLIDVIHNVNWKAIKLVDMYRGGCNTTLCVGTATSWVFELINKLNEVWSFHSPAF